MTDPADQHKPVRDLMNSLSLDGDLYMRLRGFYWSGPRGTEEPEFGYRDYSRSEMRQPIQDEAAEQMFEMAVQIAALKTTLQFFQENRK